MRTWKLSHTATELWKLARVNGTGDRARNEILGEAKRQAKEGQDVHIIGFDGKELHVERCIIKDKV